MKQGTSSSLWTVVSVAEHRFAFPVEHVQSMVELPPVSALPNAPPHCRGVIDLRGEVLQVVDLRLRLGIPSLASETHALVAMLEQREQDHRNWVATLERCLKDGGRFELATDHHLCAFGKWYYSFRTENLLLASMLKKFADPHRDIHAVAKVALDLAARGQLEEALALVRTTREGALAEMLRLFAQLRQELLGSIREIAVVLRCDEAKSFAVSVDAVEMVTPIQDEEDVSSGAIALPFLEDGIVRSLGKLGKEQHIVLTLNTASLS